MIKIIGLLGVVIIYFFGVIWANSPSDIYDAKIKMKFKDFKSCYFVYPDRYILNCMSVCMTHKKEGHNHRIYVSQTKIYFSLLDIIRYMIFKYDINKKKKQLKYNEDVRAVLEVMQRDIDRYMKKEKETVNQGQREVEDFINEQKQRQIKLRVSQK